MSQIALINSKKLWLVHVIMLPVFSLLIVCEWSIENRRERHGHREIYEFLLGHENSWISRRLVEVSVRSRDDVTASKARANREVSRFQNSLALGCRFTLASLIEATKSMLSTVLFIRRHQRTAAAQTVSITTVLHYVALRYMNMNRITFCDATAPDHTAAMETATYSAALSAMRR